MEVKSKGYDIEQVVDVIEMLSYSQGFYGRLLEEILYIEENEPEQYEVFKGFIEKQEFQNPVDVVLFFEQQVGSLLQDSSFYLRRFKESKSISVRIYIRDMYALFYGEKTSEHKNVKL